MQIETEQVDDLPVLIERLKQMRVAEIIDAHVAGHGLWGGLSKGWTALVWIAHMLMRGDHRKVHVNRLLQGCRESLSQMLGEEIRDSEFNDDRLARVLSALGQAGRAEVIERAMNTHTLRYYGLKTAQQVTRIDTTSVSVHGTADGSGLIAYGYSKDHRADLRQFKVLLATLDSLGLPLVTQLVAGNASDDGLYVPAFEEVVQTTGTDILVVGDSKMSALATRAHIHRRDGHYLTPLALVGQMREHMAEWVRAALTGSVQLHELKSHSGERIGQAYELMRQQEHTDEHGHTVGWQERVIVAHSDEYARSQERGLRERVKTAQAQIQALTAKRGPGQRRFSHAEALLTASQRIIERQAVAGLLEVALKTNRQVHYVNPRPGRPAKRAPGAPPPAQRAVEEVQVSIEAVTVNQVAMGEHIARLGWRAYATNATAEEWSVQAVIAAYRGEWRIEQGFHLLKGGSLSIAPVYLTKPEHIRGLLCLLSLALRALTLIQFSVSRALQSTHQNIKGICSAYPHQTTDRPSAAVILAAFKAITVTLIDQAGHRTQHVTPLNALQQRLLSLLDLPADLYARLAGNSSHRSTVFSER